MKKFIAASFLLVVTTTLHAQQITGTWQGTGDTGEKLRVVLNIDKGAGDALHGTLYSIDQTPDPAPVTAITFDSRILKFSIDTFHASYEGKLSADGNTITGTMTQGEPKPLVFQRATANTVWKTDALAHSSQMIAVDKDVKLEVLDWGGTGRPLVLLTGLGDNAHVFDKFAPKLAAKYHVYGITRRGFGNSSKPDPVTANYSAARLGDDVLAVIEALHLDKPIVAGHSIAGEELSYIGARHADKVAGLIYLDAGYPYALYDQLNGAFFFDVSDLRQQLSTVVPGAAPPQDQKKALDDLIAALQQVQKEAASMRHTVEDLPPPSPGPRHPPPPVGAAIMNGEQRFDTISSPALVIFVSPHDLSSMFKGNPKGQAAMEANDKRSTENQAVAFERQVPSAHVVRIPNANHYVFRSNEAQVLSEIDTFIATLPAANERPQSTN